MKGIENYTWMRKTLDEIDDQYLSNILWFIDVFWGNREYYLKDKLILNEELLERRSIQRLQWKPLPIPREIEDLVKMKLIRPNGDIIGNENCGKYFGKVIGTITHIKNWRNYLVMSN